MSTQNIEVGRRYSPLRISAYECEIDRNGNPVKNSGQIAGWYGLFTLSRLQKDIMPKLAEYVIQGKHYPFLIGTYQLKDGAVVSFPHNVPIKKVKASDIKFSRRRRKTDLVFTAIIISASEYKLLNR